MPDNPVDIPQKPATPADPTPPAPPSQTAPKKEEKPEALNPSSWLTKGLMLTLAVCCAILLACLIGKLLYHFAPKQQIIVSNFLVSAPPGTGLSADFGKEVSDLFTSDLNDIFQQGSAYAGSSYIASATGSSKLAQPFDTVPNIPVDKSYGIEIEGVSIDQILKIWKDIRYDQQLISGDIFPAGNNTGQYILQISLRSDEAAYHWSSLPFSASQSEMPSTVLRLAETFVEDINPEIAGRFFIANKNYPDALRVFTEWLKRQPGRPEPNLYLAKTLIFQGDYASAKTFAQRALDRAPSIASGNRARFQVSATQAQATALWGAGNSEEAKKLFQGPVLEKQSYALNELGTLYLEERQYGDAETTLQKALKHDSQDYGAAMVLGETYLADQKNAHANALAVSAFQNAMDLHPTSAEAAVSWLRAMHAVNRDTDASIYCRSWVGSTVRTTAVISDPTRDLYLFCAQAELAGKAPNANALRWDYAEALTHGEGNAPGEEVLYSNLVLFMPDSLCADGGNSTTPASDQEKITPAIKALTIALKKRSSVDQTAVGLAAKCEAAEQPVRPANMPGH
jgi:Tfp pilus assembly protein PilF